MNDVHARASRVARRVEATSWGLAALAAAWPLLDAAGAGGLGDLASKSLAARLAVAIAGASLAGVWVAHALVARHGLRAGARWGRDATALGLAVSLAVATVAALAGGGLGAWLLTAAPVAAVAVPLAMGWSAWSGDPPRPRASAARTVAALACTAGAGAGLAIAWLGGSAVFAPWFAGLADAAYAGGPIPPEDAGAALALFGPIGAATAGQLATLAVAIRRAPDAGLAARAAIASVLAWCLLDTAHSLAQGAVFNVLLVNLPCAALLLPPLALLAARARAERVRGVHA